MFGMGTLGLGPDIATQTTVQAAKPTVWDQINNALKVAQSGANVYSTIKTGSQQPTTSPVPAYTPAPAYTVTPAAPQPPADNTKKYLLIGGVIVLVGGTIFLATRKKGKK